MKTSKVVKHFGSKTAAAEALGITKSAVSQWKEYVPEGTAYRIQVLTGGKLQVEPQAYRSHGGQAA